MKIMRKTLFSIQTFKYVYVHMCYKDRGGRRTEPPTYKYISCNCVDIYLQLGVIFYDRPTCSAE